MKPLMFFLLAAGLCFTGCASQRPPVASVQSPAADWTVHDLFENDLRQLLAAGAGKEEAVKKLGNPDMHRVARAAYFDTFLPAFSEKDNIPPGTRARWKREYRASAETYYAGAEDANDILLFFDSQGRLRWYEHL